MNKILFREHIAPGIFHMKVEAPEIAAKRKAGQFVIIRHDEEGERVPLTIADADPKAGWISLIVQEMGYSTKRLGQLRAGDTLADVVGPLGVPTHIEKFGTCLCIGGGVGVAPLYPIAEALQAAGNETVCVIGARNKELVILEKEFKKIFKETHVCTDDGSYGFHGFVTQKAKEFLDGPRKIALVVGIGPVPMMRAVANLTKPYGVKTVVSLNPIMLDGTGMCGACRVNVGGETKFACIQGPEFDGHQVDFDLLTKRLGMYSVQEKQCTCAGGS
ncbi:MAG: sulfide/dihydroorotate dehydrogenase-like FAD/NAD-binding protein [Planctomycetota bacterium]|nr:sulfide/dihydroorotate dehydrogenase-like FAD/NAD-binding protein [Planctomycetota bacterium]